jgi:hypothetical protein
MTGHERATNESPLSQVVTRDEKSVRVDIYRDGEGGWLLEVVDIYGNSTVWDDPFPSDQEALDEALKTIAEDGIDSLIGSPADGQDAARVKVVVASVMQPTVEYRYQPNASL